MTDSTDDEVGYGKPPKEYQFKPGQSGNPKGRPKGTRNFKTDVKDTLKQPVRVKNDGKPKTVSTQHAALLRLRERALAGDGRSLDRLLGLAQTYNNEDMAREASILGQSDADILEDYNERLLRKAGVSPPNNTNGTGDEPEPGADPATDPTTNGNDEPHADMECDGDVPQMEDDDDDWLN